ncbi:MAG: HAMP domain-containing protein, partial [Desulfobacteraceae bacterium]|nr:HAMP domain-containing protein [Desulfobacteraceae bacterium]
MLNHIRFSVKIGMGYGIIAVIFAVSVGITLWQSERNMGIIGNLIEHRSPTVRSLLMLSNGINRSIGALRGWIILGQDEFKAERLAAWSEDIEPSVRRLRELSESWSDKENIKQLEEIGSNIGDFSKAQKDIEDIARTMENTPATKLLLEQGEPLFKTLDSALITMVEIEQTLEANARRKAILGLMSEVQGTLALALANLRSYLISGDENFKKEFDRAWTENNEHFKELSDKADLLTLIQMQHLKTFGEAKEKFAPISAEIFKIRGGTRWNIANAWLSERAAPTVDAINMRLNLLLSSQIKDMEKDQAEVKGLGLRFKMVEWTLLLIGLVLCVIAGYVITQSITAPLHDAVKAANRIAKGDLTEIPESSRKDE